MQAHERLQVRTDAAVVRYRKPLDRMDAILDAAAGVDHTGRPGGASDSAPEVATEDGLTVDWPVPAGPDAVHTLVVTYHATGAVAVRGANATLWWRILPADRAFDVEHAVARLSLPPGTLLAHAPWTPEPGWTITREGNLLTAEARNIAADQPATLVVPFSVDPRAIVEPRWQFNLERGLELVPAFIAGGLFILVTGIGALVMIRLQYPRRRDSTVDNDRIAVARGLRAAGIATAIVGVVLIPVTELTLGHYGVWPQVLPASVIVVGGLLFAFGARRSI